MNTTLTPQCVFPILSAEEAADLIQHGQTLGCSGFTLAGAPKAIPRALAEKAIAEHSEQRDFKLGIITGASTGASLDGSLAEADAISFRTPFQTERKLRENINRGLCRFFDLHLGQLPAYVERGWLGKINWALIEAAEVGADGTIVPTTSVGASPSFCKVADRILIELNHYHPAAIRGFHDITCNKRSPNADILKLSKVDDRMGSDAIRVDPAKIVGIVETHEKDETNHFKSSDYTTQLLGQNVAEFILSESRRGHFSSGLLPVQAGVGNVSNALLEAMSANPKLQKFSMFSEVLQDTVIEAIKSERIQFGSATSWRLSESSLQDIYQNLDFFKQRLILRSQDISNNPEIISRLGLIAINTALEVDFSGNVNSTHIMGSDIVNGIGGSGDFARNAYISIFCCPSIAKNGTISTIVPRVTHTDHSEHSVHVIITEQGIADLRGKDPRQRAECIIKNCAHPSYRDLLRFHLNQQPGGHTPFDIDNPFPLHINYRNRGNMQDYGN